MATTAAAERPLTAQERVLTANEPPPRPPKVLPQTYHQRAVANARGSGVAAAFSDPRAAPPPPAAARAAPNTTEFLAGPSAPGVVRHGVRRYEERQTSTVAMALTEEWILGRKEDEERQTNASRRRGPRDHLEGPSCGIKPGEDPKYRPTRAHGVSGPAYTTEAPYSETEVPQRAIEAEPLRGKRRYNVHDNGDILSTPNAENLATVDRGLHGAPPVHPTSRRNKANESRDVLNLGQYTREDLKESERKVVLGPREFTPQDLPARRRPTLARVKSAAKDEHDLFGTGRGAEEHVPVHAKRRGLHAPKSDGRSLFDGPLEGEKQTAKPHKPSTLLDYFEAEPRVVLKERKTEFAPPPPHERQCRGKVEAGTIFPTQSKREKEDEEQLKRRGRAKGLYVPKSNGVF